MGWGSGGTVTRLARPIALFAAAPETQQNTGNYTPTSKYLRSVTRKRWDNCKGIPISRDLLIYTIVSQLFPIFSATFGVHNSHIGLFLFLDSFGVHNDSCYSFRSQAGSDRERRSLSRQRNLKIDCYVVNAVMLLCCYAAMLTPPPRLYSIGPLVKIVAQNEMGMNSVTVS